MADDAWRTYVQSVTQGDAQIVMREKTGIDQGTISRWMSPDRTRSALTADTARKFATAYRRPILEVLVNAEVLTEEEAGIKAGPIPTLDDASIEALVRDAKLIIEELGRRALPDESRREQGQ